MLQMLVEKSVLCIDCLGLNSHFNFIFLLYPFVVYKCLCVLRLLVTPFAPILLDFFLATLSLLNTLMCLCMCNFSSGQITNSVHCK